MVSLPLPGPVPSPSQGLGESATRDLWLVLSGEDAAAALPQHVRGVNILVVGEPRDFERHLVELEPRVVVCAQPPADRATLALVSGERSRRPALRTVLLAPPDAVMDRLASLQAGFDDALASTIDIRELAGRLTWLGGRRPEAAQLPPRIRVTLDAVLDQEAHALWRGGRPVHLRPKEYALLRLLATNPGHAFSRVELLGLVWGPDRSADTRTVDVHVRWLRAKVEPDPERALHIVTVRGTGYRFDPPG